MGVRATRPGGLASRAPRLSRAVRPRTAARARDDAPVGAGGVLPPGVRGTPGPRAVSLGWSLLLSLGLSRRRRAWGSWCCCVGFFFNGSRPPLGGAAPSWPTPSSIWVGSAPWSSGGYLVALTVSGCLWEPRARGGWLPRYCLCARFVLGARPPRCGPPGPGWGLACGRPGEGDLVPPRHGPKWLRPELVIPEPGKARGASWTGAPGWWGGRPGRTRGLDR